MLPVEIDIENKSIDSNPEMVLRWR